MNTQKHDAPRRGTSAVVAAAVLAAAVAVISFATGRPAVALGPSTRVSTDATGGQATQPSHTPALSADGRYVGFISAAALVAFDTNGVPDVYRKDRSTGEVVLVSVTDAEALADGSSDAEQIAMSDDGNKVVFRSVATNLVAGDTNVEKDLFVRDIVAGTTKRANVDNAGTQTGFGPDFFSVSADGNKIAFISYNTLDGNPAGVYTRDVAGGMTRFINIADGAQVAISGDGTKVAFGWSAQGAYEIYLRDDADPGVLYRVNYGTSSNFADPAGLLGPDAMSFDGNIISFWSDGDAFGPLTPRPRAVYSYDHVQSKQNIFAIERLSELPDGTDGNADSGGSTNNWPKGAVSADGTKVAFTSQATNLSPFAPSGGSLVKNRTNGAVTPASLGGDSAARPVANTTMSSDGTAVAFATGANDVVPGDTNGVSDVFVSSDTGFAPVATPGEGVVFASTLDTESFSIKVARPDGTGLDPVVLALGPGPNSDPVWSPDGRRIAYVSQRAGTFNARLYIYDLVTGVETAVIPTSTSYDADPAWHPSGTSLAFASDRSGSFDIWQIDLNGDVENTGNTATLVNLSGSPAWDSFPAYAPDGTVVYQSNRDGDFEIFARNSDGVTTQLTSNTVDDAQPAVSPDGATVAAGRSGGTIALFPLAGGAATLLPTPTGSSDAFPDWSPDSTELVYERTTNGTATLVASKLDGSALRTLAPTAGNGTEPHWFSALSLVASARTVPASPASVPFGDIPIQQDSPATEAAVQTGGLQIPASLVPLQITPSLVPLQIPASLVGLQIPASLVPLQITASLVPLQITASLVGLQIPASLVPLQITASMVSAARERLAVTPFSLLRFNAPASATVVLEGSRFVGMPFHEFSVLEVAADAVTGPRLRSLPFAQVDLSSTIGDVGLGTLLLGSTRFADISSPALDVCATLTGLGYGAVGECGGAAFAAPGPNGPDSRNGLSARPVDLTVAKVPFNDANFPLNLHLVKMSEITLASDAPLLDFSLARAELLRTTNFGSIKVADLPATTRSNAAVIDCSGDRCVGETTLYDAQLAGTLRAGFQFRHLGSAVAGFNLAEVVFGLAGAASVPYGDFTTDQLGIGGYQGPGTQAVTYTARHRVPLGAGGPTTMKLDVPASFAPLAGPALTINGTPAAAPVILDGPDTTSFVWTVDAPGGAALVATVPVAPGVYLGEKRADLSVTSADQQLKLQDVAPVRVAENNEPDDSPASATPIATNTLYVGHAAGVDLYRLDVAPDQIVDIVLNNRESTDNDIVVYHPVNAAGVRPQDRLVATTSTEPTALPLNETPDGNRFGEPVAGGTAQDIPLLDRPVAAIGDTRNGANERVSFRSLAVPGETISTYYVQVSSYLAQSSAGPYTLFATSRPAPGVDLACSPRAGVSSATRPAGARALPTVASDRKTLFLVNQDRLTELYGAVETSALLTRVDALALSPKVNGVVVPLDADANFRTKMGLWDSVPCDPMRANAVLRAGNDVIAGLVAASGADIRHIVLLGNAEVLPKGFLPDATQSGNEAMFQSELASLFSTNNGLVGAGQNLASDDPWGAVEARAYGPRFVYPPVRAVARLVETPAEMTVPIDNFLDPAVNGSLDRTTAATFGGYFMKDLATAVDNAVAQANPTALPNSRTLDASDNWTSSSLKSVLAAPPGLVSIHTHANPFGLAAPGDPDTSFTASDLEAVGDKLAGTVLMTIGCHTSTAVADVFFTGGKPTEFTQVASRNGALMFGQSGYGLGLDGSLAFSERLMSYLVEEMGRSLTIGEAMVRAKLRYLAAGLASPYDEKALAELSLTGLSMFDFGSAVAAPPPASDAPPAVTDPVSGLKTATVTITPELRKVTAPQGVYYESATSPTLGLGDVSTAPERPVVGLVMRDVTQSAGVARAAWSTARTYSAPEDIDPLITATSLAGATATAIEPQPSDVVYPVVPVSVSSKLAAGGAKRQQLNVLTSRFKSTGIVDGSTVGVVRNTVSESLAVFYGPAVLTDPTPPAITQVSAVKDNGVVRLTLKTDDAQSGVVRASALFEDAAGTHYVELSRIGPSDWVGSAPFSGTEVLVEYRALNGQGLVGTAVDKSFGFLAVTAPPAPDGVTARVIDSTPVNGLYDINAKVELSGTGRSFEYRLNGDPTWRLYTAPVAVTTAGANQFFYRVSDGATGALLVPVNGDTTPPSITITSPANGSSVLPGAVVTISFSCADPSGATCSASAAGQTGLASGATFTAPAGPTEIVVSAVDAFGNRATKSVTITGTFRFEGFLSPVKNNELNRVKAGTVIPLKWRLFDAAGTIKLLDVVREISSRQIGCDPTVPGLNGPWTPLGREGLSYKTDQYFLYEWKTAKTLAGQCREFRVTLTDGSQHRARFIFA